MSLYINPPPHPPTELSSQQTPCPASLSLACWVTARTVSACASFDVYSLGYPPRKGKRFGAETDPCLSQMYPGLPLTLGLLTRAGRTAI